ncbi:hypothetical protein BATDEDRAFT_89381 [Batrachochytrium dendrobatidis JAM81]|uniref:Uncharacterized protein n=2 Tax=Batrachochytrium dendrobatidis TaxID=109871 RepID=F4P4S5_BATDJ|nr:uncharacterized protein BATDEDRAFT_89381 [Batrachochytrium dendrobatidis JAM81]EGF79647.1 hypothetical protein BATDEDRAFT_89381 [Batrachochytrium dendrobatidis JAM81]KAJ8322585.1 hypothetical protein O5D80_008692 [Batrachochytrium dendrobatidis]KAK5673534.1 hypothetical protein QVD99_000974 [Batrachochytrium dendrobatidis]OAJ38706.1 hypothetical protein BDEG_22613 [Batrachochytrium dendrobatidis JEL423]|eukprot:XP_006679630.1 hypothetical protein BATDEDRAFT_89381 [Batrachochytrium dendrobatidis JAM81]
MVSIRIQYLLDAVQYGLDSWPKLLAMCPPAFQPNLRALADHSHAITMILLLLVSMRLFGRPIKFVHWSMIYVAGIVFGVITAISLLYVNAMLNAQDIMHQQNNGTGDYTPYLPLDLTMQYDYRNVTRLMVRSGPHGRDNYAMYLIIDTFNILAFLWFHRALIKLTYKDDTDMQAFLIDMLYRLPSVYAAFDMFENLSGASFIGWFEYDEMNKIPFALTSGFIAQASFATRIKWGVLYVMCALELTGCIKYVYDRRWKIDYENEQKEERKRQGISESEDEAAPLVQEDSEDEDTPYVSKDNAATYSADEESEDEKPVQTKKSPRKQTPKKH